MRLLRLADLAEVPWKNGGGVTRPIASASWGGQTLWRLSRADVSQDGPFSEFAGLTRILTVVSGGAMRLETPDTVLMAAPHCPVRFDGALPVFARLEDGPLTDLNLMFDPDHGQGSVRVMRGPSDDLLADDVVALHVLSGAPIICDEALAEGDTAFPSAGAGITLAKGDAVLEIAFRPVGHSEDVKLHIAAR